MPPRKRSTDDGDEPVAKRRSSRQAAAAAAVSIKEADEKDQVSVDKARKAAPSRTKERTAASEKGESKGDGVKKTNKATATAKSTTVTADEKKTPAKKGRKAKAKKEEKEEDDDDDDEAKGKAKPPSKSEKAAKDDTKSSRAVSEDANVDSIPTTNADAPRHDGEWYWLMKAEPESRFENGIDVRFSIDDLRAREKPEGWDGEFLFWYLVYRLSG